MKTNVKLSIERLKGIKSTIEVVISVEKLDSDKKNVPNG